MGRKPNTSARAYRLTPKALAQRQDAAKDRWEALKGKSKQERSLSGRPKKQRGPRRDPASGRFLAAPK